MLQQLVLLHRQGGDASLEAPGWLEVKTCLRSFWLGFKSWGGPTYRDGGEGWGTFFGAQAYAELLEIACGLKSPVLGETEVFGQVKRACQDYRHPEKSCHAEMQKVIQKMYADVKLIRTLHLKNTGSKSYGSYSRKFFKGTSTVRVLGTGSLAKEIVPWLTKSVDQVMVHSRTPQSKVALADTFNVMVQGHSEASGPKGGGLLVAAPMKAADIRRFILDNQLKVHMILDLREESSTDPIGLMEGVEISESLQDVFAVFEKTRASTQHIKEQALAELKKCVRARFKGMEFRPKGWDECAG